MQEVVAVTGGEGAFRDGPFVGVEVLLLVTVVGVRKAPSAYWIGYRVRTARSGTDLTGAGAASGGPSAAAPPHAPAAVSFGSTQTFIVDGTGAREKTIPAVRRQYREGM
ncbi:hypothetical protein [Haloplanus halophilus]|uniref:hypothetical protein n=1 Tax=Haloplanus halophilus TaxID=2949993 RepID=UPI00203FE89B|nr:hypothetical protein [Haloplanus sp. GDY1]